MKGNTRYVLFLNESETEMVENLIEYKAFRTKAEVIRTSIRALHDELLPGYVLKGLKDKKPAPIDPQTLTNEQYCELELGGRCRSGQCVFKAGSGQDVEFELSTIKSLTKDHPVVEMHQDLLSGKFVYADGSEATPEQIENILADWKAIPPVAGGTII